MLSKDYSAEFKQRFADRYADGATIAMLQHEFGLTKSTVKLWRERIVFSTVSVDKIGVMISTK